MEQAWAGGVRGELKAEVIHKRDLFFWRGTAVNLIISCPTLCPVTIRAVGFLDLSFPRLRLWCPGTLNALLGKVHCRAEAAAEALY